jgi:hypothetical protein
MVVEVSDFLEEFNGTRVVSTTRLHEYGQMWAWKEGKLGTEDREQRARKVYGIIREAEYFLSRWVPEGLYDHDGDNNCGSRETAVQLWGEQRQSIHQIYFSAVIVSRFIRITAAQLFPGEEDKARLLVSYFGDYLLGWQHDKAENQRAVNFMIPEGQCPTEAQMLRERLFGAPRIFLYYLQRLSQRSDHRHCSQHQCKAQEVLGGKYQTRHTSPAVAVSRSP